MKAFRLLGWLCAILCGITLTWSCAAFGFARVWLTSPGCGSKVGAAKLRVHTIERAVLDYRARENRWPTPADLIEKNCWHPRDLVDPWGTVIVYRYSGDEPTVISAGPDREFGTADDVKNTD